ERPQPSAIRNPVHRQPGNEFPAWALRERAGAWPHRAFAGSALKVSETCAWSPERISHDAAGRPGCRAAGPLAKRPGRAFIPGRRPHRFPFIALVAMGALLFSCASRSGSPPETQLDALRRAARSHGSDPIATRDAALAELVAPGGD